MAERLRLSWNAVDGIMQRAVRRGLSRRKALQPKRLSVDETAYRKGHDYITVVTDQESGTVVHVAKDRLTTSLGSAQHLVKGVDQVRRDEHRQLLKAGDQQLKGTKYQ